ncbi:MAG: ribonuclease J [Christensenellales bacterium]
MTGAKPIKIIPLGGIGEIGKNMTAIEYDGDIIVIDAGIAFPTEDTPGIDLIIPDYKYLVINRDKVRAFIVTHGHEDHIGAMPFVLKDVQAPVYGTKLTIAFIEHKLKEHKLDTKCLKTIRDGDIIKLGRFTVEFVKVSHSVSGSVAIAITTPQGVIFHSGDFKIDFTPIDNDAVNLQKIAQIGAQGVLLMLCESTNIEREGFSLSESSVGGEFDRIFTENTSRRIIVATFSSNIHRLQQIFDAAVKHNRKVVLSGKSIIKNTEIAARIHELKYQDGLIIDIDAMNRYNDDRLVIIGTGSQGEPMSALTRMASGDYPKVKISANDTVIISATSIPGNEKAVNNVINNLYKRGANVIYEALADVHVSGHACKEELKIIHSLIKPKFFMPVHGEYRHLKQHLNLAVSLGMPYANVIIPSIGDVVEVTKKSILIRESVPSGTLYIDGITVGVTDKDILSDRRKLSGDGIIILLTDLENKSSEVIARGLMIDESFTEELKALVNNITDNFTYDGIDDRAELKIVLKRAVKKQVWKKLNKAPMILPLIMDD